MMAGRWTIVREAPSLQRRPSQSRQRRRVVVRCVCGHEATVYLEDLDGGRSSGCRSHRCAARYGAAQQLLEEMGPRARGAEALRERLATWLLESGRRDRLDMREALAGLGDDDGEPPATRACVR